MIDYLKEAYTPQEIEEVEKQEEAVSETEETKLDDEQNFIFKFIEKYPETADHLYNYQKQKETENRMLDYQRTLREQYPTLKI